MSSPGAHNLSEHRDRQSQVGPRVELAAASRRSRGQAGRVGRAQAAGTISSTFPPQITTSQGQRRGHTLPGSPGRTAESGGQVHFCR